MSDGFMKIKNMEEIRLSFDDWADDAGLDLSMYFFSSDANPYTNEITRSFFQFWLSASTLSQQLTESQAREAAYLAFVEAYDEAMQGRHDSLEHAKESHLRLKEARERLRRVIDE